MYEVKAGHLMRLLGKDTDVNEFVLADTEAFVDRRLEEGASRHTIHKELITYNGAIKLAIKRGHCRLRLDEIKLEGFSPEYKPKKRWLREDEYLRLEAEFKPHRARYLRFFVLTGACLSEAERCQRLDVDLENNKLHLPGMKRETRDRYLPFGLLPGLEELLVQIMAELPPDQQRLFAPWSNIRRDLHAACDRISIEHVSPNDLRRTFGSWLKNCGLDSAVLARLMGHSSTRMVDKVYGRLDDNTLATAMGKLSGFQMPAVPSSVCINEDRVEEAVMVAGQRAHQEQAGSEHQDPDQQQVEAGGSRSGSSLVRFSEDDADRADALVEEVIRRLSETISPTSRKSPRKEVTPATYATGATLPRDRIELPTRGFSVPCSTD